MTGTRREGRGPSARSVLAGMFAIALAVVTWLLVILRGYSARFSAALDRVEAAPEWITAMDRDSCHRTLFELHEGLIATLGLQRT